MARYPVITISGYMNDPDGNVTAYCICGEDFGYTYEMSLNALAEWADSHPCNKRAI